MKSVQMSLIDIRAFNVSPLVHGVTLADFTKTAMGGIDNYNSHTLTSF